MTNTLVKLLSSMTLLLAVVSPTQGAPFRGVSHTDESMEQEISAHEDIHDRELFLNFGGKKGGKKDRGDDDDDYDGDGKGGKKGSTSSDSSKSRKHPGKRTGGFAGVHSTGRAGTVGNPGISGTGF